MLILFRRSKAKTLLKQTGHWCYKLNKFNLVNFTKDRGNCLLLFHKLVCLSANLSKTSLSDETLTFVDRKLSLPLSNGSEIASISSKLNCSSVVSSMNNLSILQNQYHIPNLPPFWSATQNLTPVHCIRPFCSDALISSANLYPPCFNALAYYTLLPVVLRCAR